MSGPTSTPAPTPRATPSVPPPTLLQPSSDAPVDPFQAAAASKKKKKKKSKPKPKVAKVPMTEEEKEEAMYKAAEALAIEERTAKPRPPVVEKNGVLKISRLKHWKYISAYHGPWLQLPVELLESLFSLNVDPVSLSSLASSRLVGTLHPKMIAGTGKERAKKPQPPPIDPGVFRSVIDIRRYVDEASDLAIRASSGLSAFNVSSAGAQTMQPDRPGAKNGREPNMSAIRTHRLRVMACQRLAEAFATDEIASAVMVMQGATALDDVADKVLRIEPDNPDARYVQFFQEKIPSRMVSENTTTQTLDSLIISHPHRLEFYRTRGIVKAFLNQFAGAARDYTHALVEARALRKGRQAHSREEAKSQSKKERLRKASSHSHFRTEEDDSPSGGEDCARQRHPSTLPEAPLPLEPQCLFLRASSYLLHAVWLIESETLNLEGIDRGADGGIDLRLCNLTHGKYGGVDLGNPNGPLGSRTGKKFVAYRARFNTSKFKATIETLARKSIRDHERFLNHFGEMDASSLRPEQPSSSDSDISRPQTPISSSSSTSTSYDHSAPFAPTASVNPTFTTYHPLLVESHYSILLNHLLLGDFSAALATVQKVCALAEGGLEGYPVFLPARSMAQAEFNEVMDRLLTGWGLGQGPPTAPPAVCAQPGFLTLGLSADTKLAIMPPPPSSTSSSSSPAPPPTPSSSACPPAPDGPASSSANAVAVRSSSGKGSARPPPPPLDMEVEMRSLKLLVVLLAKKGREKRMKEAETHAQLKTKPSLGSMIPLSGPRVEVILIWLGATSLANLEEHERKTGGPQ